MIPATKKVRLSGGSVHSSSPDAQGKDGRAALALSKYATIYCNPNAFKICGLKCETTNNDQNPSCSVLLSDNHRQMLCAGFFRRECKSDIRIDDLVEISFKYVGRADIEFNLPHIHSLDKPNPPSKMKMPGLTFEAPTAAKGHYYRSLMLIDSIDWSRKHTNNIVYIGSECTCPIYTNYSDSQVTYMQCAVVGLPKEIDVIDDIKNSDPGGDNLISLGNGEETEHLLELVRDTEDNGLMSRAIRHYLDSLADDEEDEEEFEYKIHMISFRSRKGKHYCEFESNPVNLNCGFLVLKNHMKNKQQLNEDDVQAFEKSKFINFKVFQQGKKWYCSIKHNLRAKDKFKANLERFELDTEDYDYFVMLSGLSCNCQQGGFRYQMEIS